MNCPKYGYVGVKIVISSREDEVANINESVFQLLLAFIVSRKVER